MVTADITGITVEVDPEPALDGRLLAPVGIPTPYQLPVAFTVKGGTFSLTGETTSGQTMALIEPDGTGKVTLGYRFAEIAGHYPDPIFHPRDNRYTRAADELVSDARGIAGRARDGHAAIAAIVNDTAEKFTYGHPTTRFYEGKEEIPHLGCGLTEGSCVDINTYLIAALRAAGFEAGYVTGYFFPAEKNGCCEDMHCWVVTRHEGVVLEWDIAHHLKMGRRDICSGLNPKPGSRVAMAHSMGLDFPELGIAELKLVGEPLWLDGNGGVMPATPDIRMARIPADGNAQRASG
ncbi:transglutaminase-like domain-containing protein [Oricola thermophila]|uniref:Transglutaminase domain-containing protein n=1 Tax=Oricola thermophila TaxID=2742145 RepID=A0A6N1VDN9_9HYPH|nr:transglutaminase-like domain-containing protein [Oricola thermophila]QKV18954.1 transglutaminase domain-containing protein [Oricola thermophila]